MRPTETILVGASLSGDEARFLRVLVTDLVGSQALILANFLAADRQIDFVVVTPTAAVILELKNFTGPIWGDRNGGWEFLNQAGQRVPYFGDNPWQQTLAQKFSLSDEMRSFQKKNRAFPLPSGRSFANDLAAFVCVWPNIHPASSVTAGDHKVSVRSYPDVVAWLRSHSTPASWSLAEWRTFAEGHLRLRRSSLAEATDGKVDAASQLLRDYCSRVSAVVSAGLPPLLPDVGTDLIERMVQPRNLQVVGPSGSAKTFHLHHLAGRLAASDDEVPLLIEAKRFTGGEFWPLLRHGTAPFFSRDPKELLEAVKIAGRRPAFLIDALNECRLDHVPELLRGAQAAVVRYGGRVVLTSQVRAQLQGDLQSATVELPLPSVSQKRQIYAYHARVPPVEALDAFCSMFTNAYDLALAGHCHALGAQPTSRVQLYDRYVRRALPKDSAVALVILRTLAGHLGRECSVACHRDVFEISAEASIAAHGASFRLLDELRTSRLIRLTEDDFSFEHELLLDHFRADDLRRVHPRAEELAKELRKPRHHDLLELIVPRLTDPTDIDIVLAAAQNVEVLEQVYAGSCGPAARARLLSHCSSLLSEAVDDLSHVSVELTVVEIDSRNRCAGIVLRGAKRWSPYQALLHSIVAIALDDHDLQRRFLELLDLTESTLRRVADEAARRADVPPWNVWSEVIRFYGGGLLHGEISLPCSTILSRIREQATGRGRHATNLPFRQALLERVDLGADADFALLALLHDRSAAADPLHIEANLKLAKRAWKSRVSILRLDALDLLQAMNRAIEHQTLEWRHVCDLLETFETNDIMLNSFRLEILANYGGFEPPVSADCAIAEMRALVAPAVMEAPETIALADALGHSTLECLASAAYGAIGKIFEDIFQGAYMEAYDALTSSEKRELLSLALQTGEDAWHTAWMLQELLRCDDCRSLSIYVQFGGGLNPQSMNPQEAVGAFVLAMEGCARYSDVPPPYARGDSPEHQAWQVFGEIIFWMARAASDPNGAAKAEAAFTGFGGAVRFAAAETFQMLRRARWQLGERHPATDLVTLFPNQVKPILEDSLRESERLRSLFPRFAICGDDLLDFVISAIGEVGDRGSMSLLQGLVDDPSRGPAAVKALARIQRANV